MYVGGGGKGSSSLQELPSVQPVLSLRLVAPRALSVHTRPDKEALGTSLPESSVLSFSSSFLLGTHLVAVHYHHG